MADEILTNYQHVIDEVTLITSSGGAFEVKVDGELLFSKKTIQKRHAAPGEVLSLIRQFVGHDVPTYSRD